MEKRIKAFLLPILILLLMVVIVIGWLSFNNSKNPSGVSNIDKEKYNIEYTDFYEKVSKKEDINYLIIGDSIGQSSGTGDKDYFWFNLLNEKLKKEFNINFITTKKITAGGATIFDGYVNYFPTDIVHAYDLVFICFGQNDQAVMSPKDYGIFYENLIRSIKENNPKAEIVSLIESSIEDEEFADTAKKLSKRHNTILIDTRDEFWADGKTKAEMTVDSIHPTNEGYEIYADVIFKALKQSVDQKKKPAELNKKLMYPENQYTKLISNSSFDTNEGFENYSFSNNNYFTSNKKGSYLEKEFVGNMIGFTLLGTDDSGLINVYIDGELKQQVNPYTAEPREKQIIISNDLSKGKHTIKLEASGEYGFDYKGKPTKGKSIYIRRIITNDTSEE